MLAKVQEVRNDELFTNRLISTSDRDITKAAYDVAFACAFLTGIIFGFLPARKAAQLDPIEALARD